MAAAQLVKDMPPFNLDMGEDFTEYSERFGQFLLANSVGNADMKRAVFLSTVGAPAYKLLRGLLGAEVTTKSFDDLVKTLKEHLQPAPNVIAERFKFNKRDRKQGESVNSYIAELRKYSEHCAFGDGLNEYLRDRFVCGLNSQSIQQKLLAVKDLDLTRALEIARSFESSSKDAKLLGAPGAMVGSVHQTARVEENEEDCGGDCVLRLQHQTQRGAYRGAQRGSQRGGQRAQGLRDTRECYRCGNQGHISTSCPYSTYNCRRCGKTGHLEKRCRSEKSEVSKPAAIRKVCACSAQGNCGMNESD